MVGAVNGQEMVKRQRAHKARLQLTGAQAAALDEQASAAITVWNCLHAYWTHFAGKKPTLAQADAAIRQARKDADFLAMLPAQAAHAHCEHDPFGIGHRPGPRHQRRAKAGPEPGHQRGGLGAHRDVFDLQERRSGWVCADGARAGHLARVPPLSHHDSGIARIAVAVCV
jgi:hypothetical protein